MSRRRKHNSWEDEWQPSSPPPPVEKRQRRPQPKRRAATRIAPAILSSSSSSEPLSPPRQARQARPLRRLRKRNSISEPLSPLRRRIQTPSLSSSSSSQSKGKEEVFVVVDPPVVIDGLIEEEMEEVYSEGDALNPIDLSAERVSQPFPVDEPADPYAMLIEMGALVRDMQLVIENERRAFGENTELTPDMLDLINDTEAFVRLVRQEDQIILLSDYLDSLRDFQTRLRRINTRIVDLGRRCLNYTDPADPFVDIPDLDDTEYIRLENGMCWDIMSLYLHIKRFNGANTRGDLQQYPHQQIWSGNAELERILNHPMRNEPSPPELPNGFRSWWDANRFPRLAQLISLETLRRINDFHNLMTNNGPAYEKAVRERMTKEEQEAQRMFQGQYINNIPSAYREAFKDSEIKRQELFKSDAIIDFAQYFENLAQEERDALEQFRPQLNNELRQCMNNQLCVYQMGGNMRDLYNRIADLRDDVPPFRV